MTLNWLSFNVPESINAIIDSFIQELENIAEHLPRLTISEITSINARKKLRDIKRLVDTFNEIYETHIEIYIALEKELHEPIQLEEKKRFTRIILDTRSKEIKKYLKIINVKAEVYLDDIDFVIDRKLKNDLIKLSKITFEYMKTAWISESETF